MLNQSVLDSLTTRYKDRPVILEKIQAVSTCLADLKQQRLPKVALPKLLYSQKKLERDPALLPLDEAFGDLRQSLIADFGIWFLPNEQLIDDLENFIAGRPVIELMAGNALLTAALLKRGIQASATDTLDWQGQDNERPTPWTPVKEEAALKTVQRAIAQAKEEPNSSLPVFILAWAPNGDESDWQILCELRKSQRPFDLLVIGEKDGDTNSQAFWSSAKLSQPSTLNGHYQAFDAYQDAIYLAK
ncbi:SAM-dependent methyltransferase [Fructobacillus parabroussonetiae]|uniref:SAM-dependent methyltransferase n=1 Tax=Fructobacillus parabroussonetiae TaxID=2713174 RepID=A0ABS5QYY3_9LACO|nr:SAM-dependent methyltransferase [Fructobacillus parabroussonetiae]MBS9337591.1 SAM-dependent methyltransferase [Fructobacillus parabroussonetiae]